MKNTQEILDETVGEYVLKLGAKNNKYYTELEYKKLEAHIDLLKSLMERTISKNEVIERLSTNNTVDVPKAIKFFELLKKDLEVNQ